MSDRVLIFTAYHKPGLRLSDGGTCKRFVTTIPRTPAQSKRAFTFTTTTQQHHPPQSSSRASADLPSCA